MIIGIHNKIKTNEAYRGFSLRFNLIGEKT